jgi:uncharacterized protein YjbK
MIEKEKKIILNLGQYRLLNSVFKWQNEFTQINFYYLDDNNEMVEREITIRVRIIEARIFLQIKIPIEEKGSVHIKKEYEVQLDAVPVYIKGDFIKSICNLSVPNVRLAGFLITERKIYNWNNKEQICLDRNIYLNYEDYEIEIEYEDEIDPVLLQIILERGIELDKKVNGKNKRFVERYYNLRLKNN